MVVGACAGSTGGGIKVSRLVILLKSVTQEIKRLHHPKAVTIVRVNGRKIGAETRQGVYVYFICYIFIIIGSTLLVSLDNFDFATTISAVLTTVNNVGPGIALVGPVENFAKFSVFFQADFLFGYVVWTIGNFPDSFSSFSKFLEKTVLI